VLTLFRSADGHLPLAEFAGSGSSRIGTPNIDIQYHRRRPKGVALVSRVGSGKWGRKNVGADRRGFSANILPPAGR
jgi:hypothetical protein